MGELFDYQRTLICLRWARWPLAYLWLAFVLYVSHVSDWWGLAALLVLTAPRASWEGPSMKAATRSNGDKTPPKKSTPPEVPN